MSQQNCPYVQTEKLKDVCLVTWKTCAFKNVPQIVCNFYVSSIIVIPFYNCAWKKIEIN